MLKNLPGLSELRQRSSHRNFLLTSEQLPHLLLERRPVGVDHDALWDQPSIFLGPHLLLLLQLTLSTRGRRL